MVCTELFYVLIHINTLKSQEITVTFNLVAVLLVTNQKKEATDSVNSKSSTTQHKQT